MGVSVRLWAAIVVAATGAARDAEACSCRSPTAEIEVYPIDGATEFPTDGRLRVVTAGGVVAAIVRRLGEELRLRGPDGELVALSPERHGRVLVLTPNRPLRPSSRYAIERVFAFSADGARRTDHERLEHARWGGACLERSYPDRGPPKAIARRFAVVSHFTTAAGPERDLPAAPELAEARIHFMYGGGDCGPGSYVSVDYRAAGQPSGSGLFGVELAGRGVVWTFRPDGQARTGFGTRHCDPDPVEVGFREDLEARMVAISSAGRTIAEPRWTKVRPWEPLRVAYLSRGDPPADAEADAREARDRARFERRIADAFFSPPMTRSDALGPSESGPPGCRWGLEGVGSIALPPGTLPWMAGSATVLRWSAGRARTLYTDDRKRRIELVEFDLGGQVERSLLSEADEAVAAFARGDVLAAAIVFAADASASQIRVSRHSRDGRRWQQILPGAGVRWHPRVAWAGADALVAWSTPEGRTSWAVLDAAADGRLRADPGSATGSRDGDVAVAVDDAGFLLAWVDGDDARAAARWGRVGVDGKLELEGALPPGRSGLDWAEDGAALVSASPDGIELWPRHGRRLSAPIRVDRGTGRGWSPRVARLGALYAVVWRTGAGGFVTVLDAEGRVAAPTPIERGIEVSGPAITAVDDGVLVVHGAGSVNFGLQPRAARFRCRTSPGGEPPATLREVR